jgi:hypothetical protein
MPLLLITPAQHYLDAAAAYTRKQTPKGNDEYAAKEKKRIE